MADAETPMTTRKEVHQRRRGLYWLVALLALVVLGLALFGLTDDLTEEGQSLTNEAVEAPLAEGADDGANDGAEAGATATPGETVDE